MIIDFLDIFLPLREDTTFITFLLVISFFIHVKLLHARCPQIELKGRKESLDQPIHSTGYLIKRFGKDVLRKKAIQEDTRDKYYKNNLIPSGKRNDGYISHANESSSTFFPVIFMSHKHFVRPKQVIDSERVVSSYS